MGYMLEKKDLLSDMLSKGIIYIEGVITSDTAREFCMAVAWLESQNREKAKLYLDSKGGNVIAGLDMYDMLRHTKVSFDGIVCRQAHSIASVILQGCTRRYALAHAEIKIHSLKVSELSLDKYDEDIDGALAVAKEEIGALAEKITLLGNNIGKISDLLNSFVGKIEDGLSKTLGGPREKQQSIVDIYKLRTGKEENEIRETLRMDKAMTAQEARDFGLIDEVITSYKI